MDKNKSTHKLKGLPHIYCINLDEKPDRWKFMEDQFKYWEVEDYTRVSAYDGRGDNDLGEILKGRYPDQMSSGEVGCVTSHLKAMKMFLETDAPCALMMEDDCDISTAFHWGFKWRDFYSKIPYDWDCVQLTTICTGDIHVRLHLKFINDFSAAIYLITRHHASKIIKNHIRGDKFRLDNGVIPRAVSEDTILETGKTYTIPLFLYNLDMGSAIHPEHISIFHKNPHDAILNFWHHQGCKMSLDEFMTFDPYYGRTAGSSQQDT